MGLALSSPAFTPGGEIPALFTCEGQDLSPALDWTGVPEAAESLVLIIDDPDAPDPSAPKMTWVHWVLYNIPPMPAALPRAVAARRPSRGHQRGDERLETDRATAGPARRLAGTATSTSSTPSTRCSPTSARREGAGRGRDEGPRDRAGGKPRGDLPEEEIAPLVAAGAPTRIRCRVGALYDLLKGGA